MSLAVVWTPKAQADLLGIVEFIAQRNPMAAVKLGQSIKESTWPLSEHPMLFKRSQRVLGCREIVVHPNYIVLYKITPAVIEIVAVVHASRHYPA